VCALAASLGLHTARVDLEDCSEEADLFRRIAGALEFPDWFGANWDALYDCLTDLSWLPARGYVLVFENGGELADAAPQVMQTLRDLLIESAAAWRERGIAFRAVLGAS
jgi:RNAse (barnase) inhibitor barstar